MWISFPFLREALDFFFMTYNVIEASKEMVPLKRLKFLGG